MSNLIRGFKDCAHQAGERCSFSNGMLIREFLLGDFLENKVSEQDRAPDIAIKAIEFFCDERDPFNKRFKFGVLTVGIFLDSFHSSCPHDSLQQPLKDLVALLTKGSASEQQVRKWIDSHFSEA